MQMTVLGANDLIRHAQMRVTQLLRKLSKSHDRLKIVRHFADREGNADFQAAYSFGIFIRGKKYKPIQRRIITTLVRGATSMNIPNNPEREIGAPATKLLAG